MSNFPKLQIAKNGTFFESEMDFDQQFAIKIYIHENKMEFFTLTLNSLLDILKQSKDLIMKHSEQKYHHLLNQKD